MKKKPTPTQLKAYRDARIANYARTRSAETLACMIVELEDSTHSLPEFEYEDEWPVAVRAMRMP